MKFSKISILGLLFMFAICNSSQLRKFSSESEIIEGTSSNVPGMRSIDAVAYSYENEKVKNASPFKDHVTTRSPLMVEKIQKSPMERVTSEVEVVGDSMGSQAGSAYYDGNNNLKSSNEECAVYSTRPNDCLSNSRCGWCDNIKRCVKGGRSGPLGNLCNKENYIYFSPGRDWDPLGMNNRSQTGSTEDRFDSNVTFH